MITTTWSIHTCHWPFEHHLVSITNNWLFVCERMYRSRRNPAANCCYDEGNTCDKTVGAPPIHIIHEHTPVAYWHSTPPAPVRLSHCTSTSVISWLLVIRTQYKYVNIIRHTGPPSLTISGNISYSLTQMLLKTIENRIKTWFVLRNFKIWSCFRGWYIVY